MSLPLEGKETAAGCRMRCSRPRTALPFSHVRTTYPLCVILSEGRSPKSNPIEMSEANAMRARSVATQGSRSEFDLSYSNKCYILSRECTLVRRCNFPFGKLLVILRRSRFGTSASRFCLLGRLRLLSTRKSSTTFARCALSAQDDALKEVRSIR